MNNTNNTGEQHEASVRFSLGKGVVPIGTFAILVIQTIIIVATVVGVYSNHISRLNQLVEDNASIKKELQSIRTEFVTKSEASVQFLFIKDQLTRQDKEISDIQAKIYSAHNK